MSPPWMPLYVADYRQDTAHLSAAEHGAYLLLIMHYWSAACLPIEDRQLARIAAMTATEWKRARPSIEPFFHDGWKHKRIDAELARAADISTKRRASAGQRYSKRNANADANAEQLDTHAGASPQPQGSEAIASAADAAPQVPVYTDSRHELWGEGTAILVQLGIAEKSARANIGRWLKGNDDAHKLLGVIQRARDNRIINPIPWITQALAAPTGTANVAESRSCVAAARRATDSVARASGLGDRPSEPVFRLISQS